MEILLVCQPLCTGGGPSVVSDHVTRGPEAAACFAGRDEYREAEGVSIFLLSHTGKRSTELSRTASPPVSR